MLFGASIGGVNALVAQVFGTIQLSSNGGSSNTAYVTASANHTCAMVTAMSMKASGDNIDIYLEEYNPANGTSSYILGKQTISIDDVANDYYVYSISPKAGPCQTTTNNFGRGVTSKKTCQLDSAHLAECVIKNRKYRVKLYNGSLLGGTAYVGGYVEFVA